MESLAGSRWFSVVLDVDSLGFIAEIMSMKIDQWSINLPFPPAAVAVSSAGAINAASWREIGFLR
jgi:hypothetical protein